MRGGRKARSRVALTALMVDCIMVVHQCKGHSRGLVDEPSSRSPVIVELPPSLRRLLGRLQHEVAWVEKYEPGLCAQLSTLG